MDIKVHLINDNKTHSMTLPKSALVSDTLVELEIPPDTVIITRNGQPIPLDAELANKDELSVIRVISGG
ncbi:MAG: MoaD/ThiS family protein [Thermoplasmata archaeon]|nr:MoaD/ThiS family protein [Thermoplasmata archaeon]